MGAGGPSSSCMSGTPSRRPLAGPALAGVFAVGLVLLGLRLGQDDELRDELGPVFTVLCFLVLGLALGGVAVTLRRYLGRSSDETSAPRPRPPGSWAGPVLAGVVGLGLVLLGLKLGQDDELREELGPTCTAAIFLVLGLFGGGVVIKVRPDLGRSYRARPRMVS